MTLDKDKLRDKTLGSIMGIGIGDALGLPVESKSPEAIQKLFGFVDGYVTNKHHGYPAVARRSAGTVSDDTQLSLALIDSLTRKNGYDLADIAAAHVEAFEGKWGTPVGWGGSTKAAIAKIKAGEQETFTPGGAGNGPTIKIAPLGIYCCYKTATTSYGSFTNHFNASLLKKCFGVTLLTHSDARCVVAAYCQARMVIRAMQDEIPDNPAAIAELFVSDAQYAESHLNTQWPEDGTLSEKMKALLTPENFSRETGVISAEICTSNSSYIMNSYPLTAYCVSKYMPFRNFRLAVTMTVNAGADADSNGSMVGAIAGAALGFHAVPSDLVTGMHAWREILRVSKKFHVSL